MPEYTFRNTDTNEEVTLLMSYKEKETFLKNNPEAESVLSTLHVVSDVGYGGMKHTPEFREVLQKVKHHHPKTTVDPGNLTEI